MFRLIPPLLIILALGAGLIPLVVFALQQGGLPTLDDYVWRVTRFTILQASLSTLLSVVPAIFVARALARQRFPGRNVLLNLFAVPLSLPVIVAVFGLTTLYGASGIFGGWFNIYGLVGIVLAHVFFNLPLATRMILSSLDAAPAENHRLSAQLGFADRAIMRHVDWPQIVLVLPRVAALVFLLCAGSFVVVLVLGGPAATTLEVAIYQSLRMDFDVSRALALSLVQICLSALLVFATARVLLKPEKSTAFRHDATRFDGKGLWLRATDSVFILAATLLVLPVMAAIVTNGLLHLQPDKFLLRAVITSIAVALLSASMTLPLCWGMAQAGFRVTRWRSVFAGLGLAGYIVPPAVLATGWFLAFRNVDGGVALAILLIAAMNALMSLPFMLTVLTPALEQQAQHHDRLCDQLGLKGYDRLRLIDIPSAKGPLAQAAMMAFVLSMGDLTAVTLLGSQGLVTLPSLVQQQMGHYQSDAAGGTALVLAAICLAITVLAQRLSRWT